MIIKEPDLPGDLRPDLAIMTKDVAIVIEVIASSFLPLKALSKLSKYIEIFKKATGIEKVYGVIVCPQEAKIEESVEELARKLNVKILYI